MRDNSSLCWFHAILILLWNKEFQLHPIIFLKIILWPNSLMAILVKYKIFWNYVIQLKIIILHLLFFPCSLLICNSFISPVVTDQPEQIKLMLFIFCECVANWHATCIYLFLSCLISAIAVLYYYLYTLFGYLYL